jgi:hypothetical protein
MKNYPPAVFNNNTINIDAINGVVVNSNTVSKVTPPLEYILRLRSCRYTTNYPPAEFPAAVPAFLLVLEIFCALLKINDEQVTGSSFCCLGAKRCCLRWPPGSDSREQGTGERWLSGGDGSSLTC